MAEILNALIAAGGTTALTDPQTADSLLGWCAGGGPRAVWHVAVEAGQVVGFQWIEPNAALGEDVAEIASFADPQRTGRGIGTALFAATKLAARAQGFAWINANIRSDNASGLRYYAGQGFRTYATREGVELANGLIVDKTLKRFDL